MVESTEERKINPGMLSLTTDFEGGTNNATEPIAMMGEAGIEFAHWCHEWNTGYIYTKTEILEIRNALEQSGVKLLDTHGSEFPDSLKQPAWISSNEAMRKEGVKVVQNRLEMTHTLGGHAVVMHIPAESDSRFSWVAFTSSMNDLRPVIEATGIPLAFENLYGESVTLPDGEKQYIPENINTIRSILNQYSQEVAGWCLDTGHWNIERYGYGKKSPVWEIKDRLIAVHLHGNQGGPSSSRIADDHMLPNNPTDTVDWLGVSRFLASSAYAVKPLSYEASLKEHYKEGMTTDIFLHKIKVEGNKLVHDINKEIFDLENYMYAE